MFKRQFHVSDDWDICQDTEVICVSINSSVGKEEVKHTIEWTSYDIIIVIDFITVIGENGVSLEETIIWNKTDTETDSTYICGL